jgi:hypothetical protein
MSGCTSTSYYSDDAFQPLLLDALNMVVSSEDISALYQSLHDRVALDTEVIPYTHR